MYLALFLREGNKKSPLRGWHCHIKVWQEPLSLLGVVVRRVLLLLAS